MSLSSNCEPCKEQAPFVPVAKLPETLCPNPCPVPVERPSLLPTIRTETIVTSCLRDAIHAMATQFYCDLSNGPKGCDK